MSAVINNDDAAGCLLLNVFMRLNTRQKSSAKCTQQSLMSSEQLHAIRMLLPLQPKSNKHLHCDFECDQSTVSYGMENLSNFPGSCIAINSRLYAKKAISKFIPKFWFDSLSARHSEHFEPPQAENIHVSFDITAQHIAETGPKQM